MKLRGDIKQRDLERWEELYNEYGIDELKGAARIAGKVVQAAIEAGWVTGLEPHAVADMDGKAVRKLSGEVLELYYSMGSIDPKS